METTSDNRMIQEIRVKRIQFATFEERTELSRFQLVPLQREDTSNLPFQTEFLQLHQECSYKRIISPS